MKNLTKHLTENYTHNELAELANNGAVTGFGDFVYYSSTTKYFEQFKDECFECLQKYNDECGFSGFPDYINQNWGEYHLFANAMIWFSIEYIARELTQGEYVTESDEV
jgi:hypothetical protein